MFTRRRYLDRRRHYTREFLESLASRLTEAGFDVITVVLPHNYPSVDPKNSELSLSDFLQRERNYAAVIFKASSASKKETLKILFINSNSRAVFADDTFPVAESEPSGMFFQSPDPARAYALFEYFYELLTSQSLAKFVVLGMASLASFLVVLIQIVSLISGKIGLLASQFGLSRWIDIGISLICLLIMFRFTALPTGLWIKPKRELKLLYLANMALKGELRDNPLVQVAITIVGGLIVAILAKILGLI